MKTSPNPSQPATGLQSIADLLLLGPKLVASFLQTAAQLLGQSSELLVKNMRGFALPGFSGCCDIPETDCPPRCVCELHFEARPGDARTATVRVTNRSPQARNFSFFARPFQTASGPVPVTVTPANSQLAPNASVVLKVSFTAASAFQLGQIYGAELLIHGAYEQCVCLTCEVPCERTEHCEVEQGDLPKRIRAHQWQDHFQCEEPCFPAPVITGTVGDIPRKIQPAGTEPAGAP